VGSTDDTSFRASKNPENDYNASVVAYFVQNFPVFTLTVAADRNYVCTTNAYTAAYSISETPRLR